MTEVVVAALLAVATGSMGFSMKKLFDVTALVSRIDERTHDHERRITNLEDVA